MKRALWCLVFGVVFLQLADIAVAQEIQVASQPAMTLVANAPVDGEMVIKGWDKLAMYLVALMGLLRVLSESLGMLNKVLKNEQANKILGLLKSVIGMISTILALFGKLSNPVHAPTVKQGLMLDKIAATKTYKKALDWTKLSKKTADVLEGKKDDGPTV